MEVQSATRDIRFGSTVIPSNDGYVFRWFSFVMAMESGIVRSFQMPKTKNKYTRVVLARRNDGHGCLTCGGERTLRLFSSLSSNEKALYNNAIHSLLSCRNRERDHVVKRVFLVWVSARTSEGFSRVRSHARLARFEWRHSASAVEKNGTMIRFTEASSTAKTKGNWREVTYGMR